MKDYESISFPTQGHMKEYFKNQELTDRWLRVKTEDLYAMPLDDVHPLMIRNGVIPCKYHGHDINGSLAGDVTDDGLVESMKNSKLLVAFPDEKEQITVYPVRYTAFPHIQDRAGISGRSVSSLRDRCGHKEMAADKRAEIINYGLELCSDRTLILIRDGKVTSLMSGDEKDYSVLPMIQLIKATENELEESYRDYEFLEATSSYEITSVTYDLGDAALKTRITNLLKGYGVPVDDEIKISIRLTSSDTGLCEARLTPIVKIGDVPLPIGTVKDLKHANKATISMFIALAHEVLVSYRDLTKELERMMKITIRYPSSCFKRVYEKLGLSGYASLIPDMMERIEDEHASACSAFDLYWYMNELLFQKSQQAPTGKDKQKADIYANIKAQETVANMLKLDFGEYDYL